MNPEILSAYRARHPEISEQEALSDLWMLGIRNDATLRAREQHELETLNYHHGVIQRPEELTGWHLVHAIPHKPGVLRIFRTRTSSCSTEGLNGFCRQDVLRVAIETGICSKPDGWTMPI